MTITLSPETQKLLEERIKIGGFKNADEALRVALENSAEIAADDRSPETLAAIREGLIQARAGLGRPWEEFEKEWVAKHSKKRVPHATAV